VLTWNLTQWAKKKSRMSLTSLSVALQKIEGRRQSRLRDSELIAMRLRQPEHFA